MEDWVVSGWKKLLEGICPMMGQGEGKGEPKEASLCVFRGGTNES
jgi:hypothetical protein